MNKGIALALAALLLSACSGNFGTGTGIPQQGGNQLPPMGGNTMPQSNGNGMPQPNASGSPLPSPSPETYQIADAQDGFACPPTQENYGCKLSFNLPPPTPEPSPSPKHNGKATPTPSPSPTPTPSPSPEGSASPTASPTPAGGTITVKAQAQPVDAPKLVHIPPDSIVVVPLTMVTLTTNADFPLDGWVNAQFTLPKEQYAKGRGFAVQLFSQSTKKKSVNYTPIWTFDRSSLDTDTLTFSFKPPKMKIAKGSTYVLVLYGDDTSKMKASPAPGSSATPEELPTPPSEPSAATSPEPEPTPTS